MRREGRRLCDLGMQSMGRRCAQNRRPTRLTGCFVPRHLNSPRLALSSLSSSSSSSPSRSCPLVLVLLFGRGGESESSESDDDDIFFESTLLRATEAGA